MDLSPPSMAPDHATSSLGTTLAASLVLPNDGVRNSIPLQHNCSNRSLSSNSTQWGGSSQPEHRCSPTSGASANAPSLINNVTPRSLTPPLSSYFSSPLLYDLDFENLLHSLSEDLYTNPLLGFKPSIKFQAIRDNFSEIQFSLTSQKLYICSFHPTVHRLSFVLRKIQE